jgi:hypothetical protein
MSGIKCVCGNPVNLDGLLTTGFLHAEKPYHYTCAKALGLPRPPTVLQVAIEERDAYKKASEILLEAMECANNQWGDDYLWKKFKLSDELDRAKAIVEGLTKKAEAE